MIGPVESFVAPQAQARLAAREGLDPDPFTENDVLESAQMVGLRLDLVQGAAQVLFDLRVSDWYREFDVGLLSLVGVDGTDIARPRLGHALMSHGVDAMRVSIDAAGVRVALIAWPNGNSDSSLRMGFVAREASFVAGLSPSIGDGPATYGMDVASEIDFRTPKWTTEFTPLRFGRIAAAT